MAVAGVALELQGLRQEFEGGVRALEPLDLRVEPGQFLALLGPSGCGKSTLLRLIAGLDAPKGGALRLEPGRDEARLAYVFQDPHLLPWRSALHNVALPLELQGFPRAQREAAAARALARVGLAEWTGAYPAQLSGGMRMRVSLARALVTAPRLLLLDEPFAALDEQTRLRLDLQLRELWAESGATVVFVTHSISEAVFLAERVVVFSPRPARVVADVAVDLPPARDLALRATVSFAQQVGALFELLERG